MNNNLQTINQILEEATKQSLYKTLIKQLNKDFNLAGLSEVHLSVQLTPKALQEELFTSIEHLIRTNFEGFLAFLYRIDLSEKQVKNLPKGDFKLFKSQVSFLILQREWKKIWLRNTYS